MKLYIQGLYHSGDMKVVHLIFSMGVEDMIHRIENR